MTTEQTIRLQWSRYIKLYQKNKNENSNSDDTELKLRNLRIAELPSDYLYHLGLSTDDNLSKMFGDVKFVCMGGKATRMKSAAKTIMEEIGYSLPIGSELEDLTKRSERFSMFKVGPVICVNHGMGEPSLSILLHEIIKLLHYAKAKDPILFRIGTSGGIGVDPGTVIVAKKAVNGYLEEFYELPILGKPVKRPAILHSHLADDLIEVAKELHFPVTSGTTMSALDFYEGQGRLDGAVCDYTKQDKGEFLNKAFGKGVRNIEMEAAAMSALTYHAGIKAAIINVTLLNRLEQDQVLANKELLSEWEMRPQKLVARYIRLRLEIDKTL